MKRRRVLRTLAAGLVATAAVIGYWWSRAPHSSWIKAGQPAPELALLTIGASAPTRISQFRGRPVLLTMFVDDCPACEEVIGRLERLHREFGRHGLVVLGVATDLDPAARARYVEKLGITFFVMQDPGGTAIQQSVRNDAAARAVPDRQGRDGAGRLPGPAGGARGRAARPHRDAAREAEGQVGRGVWLTRASVPRAAARRPPGRGCPPRRRAPARAPCAGRAPGRGRPRARTLTRPAQRPAARTTRSGGAARGQRGPRHHDLARQREQRARQAARVLVAASCRTAARTAAGRAGRRPARAPRPGCARRRAAAGACREATGGARASARADRPRLAAARSTAMPAARACSSRRTATTRLWRWCAPGSGRTPA